MKKRFALAKVYGLLEPGPVVMLTTSRKGRPNVMTTKECVINVPTRELAEEAVKCGNASGRTVDKFKAFGLTAAPAARVEAPLIAERYASLECKVVDTRTAAGGPSWSPARRSSCLQG